MLQTVQTRHDNLLLPTHMSLLTVQCINKVSSNCAEGRGDNWVCLWMFIAKSSCESDMELLLNHTKQINIQPPYF